MEHEERYDRCRPLRRGDRLHRPSRGAARITARLHRLSNGVTVVCDPMPGLETLASASLPRRQPRRGCGPLGLVAPWSSTWCSRAPAAAPRGHRRGGRGRRWSAQRLDLARHDGVPSARLLPGDLALGVDLIADLVRAPVFAEEELEREKQVVLAELGESRDRPTTSSSSSRRRVLSGADLRPPGAGRRGDDRGDRHDRAAPLAGAANIARPA